MALEVKRFSDIQQFYPLVEAFLMRDEAQHNLLLGIGYVLMQTANPEPPLYLACVEDRGQIVGCAMMTLPYNLLLSEMTTSAIFKIAEDVYTLYPQLDKVNAIKRISRAFAEHWQTISGRAFELDLAERIYQLESVNMPKGVAGTIRLGAIEDRDLLIEWLLAFNREALEEMPFDLAEKWVDRAIEGKVREVYLWVDQGHPVSMAALTGRTPHGRRVGAVYTPPPFRNRGYASACVGAVSQRALDQGLKFVFLYTDLANPTSNHIYQELGYQPVIDVDQYKFI
ncbi:MAG: GNAT family N-acetyltransferase [Anaerolineae bacterium]|jgi:hypothetical protein|nr:GNAT family N-acetyltransferase [Anaerolineae bacterium]